DEMCTAFVAALGLRARQRETCVLQLLEQPVDVVGVDAPGLAEAHREAVGEVAAVPGSLEKEPEQGAPQRRRRAAHPSRLLRTCAPHRSCFFFSPASPAGP